MPNPTKLVRGAKALDDLPVIVKMGEDTYKFPPGTDEVTAKRWIWNNVISNRSKSGEEKIELPSELPSTSVKWDANSGSGAVPLQSDTDFAYYNGFVREMEPGEFLGHTKEGEAAVRRTERDKPDYMPKMREAMEKGEKFAPPFLTVQWNPKRKVWDVTGHEGRHRSVAARDIGSEDKIPVQIIPHDEKGNKIKGDRKLTPEQLAAPIVGAGAVAGVSAKKLDPGIYVDEDSGKYFQITESGELKELPLDGPAP